MGKEEVNSFLNYMDEETEFINMQVNFYSLELD